MKKFLVLGVCCLVLLAAVRFASADDVVLPAQCAFTNNRADGVMYVSDAEFYKGATILFTNCMLQTTGTSTQGLTGVTVEMKWGSTSSSNCYTGTTQVAASGTWWLSITAPTNWDAPNIQVKVTDSVTNSYIYPWKLIHLKTPM